MPWAKGILPTRLKPMTIEEQGYLIPALNTDSTDYVACAVRLARSIRQHHPGASISALTLTPCDDSVFDHIISLPFGDCSNGTNLQANDWQIFYASPYRETIKLEADMLMAGPCNHWWTLFRHRDLVLSTGCRTWKDSVSTARHYRKTFDNNQLPDVYNAVTYWRRSKLATEFFRWVKRIFLDWPCYKRLLKYPDEQPSTDVVYAMAAVIVGCDQVTMPWTTYPKIVHMKPHHAGTHSSDWTKELVWEHDPLRIQTLAQWGAFHYQIKTWQ